MRMATKRDGCSLAKTCAAEALAAQGFQKKIPVTARWARRDRDDKNGFMILAVGKYLIF